VLPASAIYIEQKLGTSLKQLSSTPVFSGVGVARVFVIYLAIFQLCHGESKIIFNEIMMRFAMH
jgi:hypothetical protein